MLEVMTRRCYRIRPLEHVQVTERNGRPLLTAEYVHGGHDYLVIATVADGSESADRSDLTQLIDALPSGRTVLVDLYVTSEAPEDEGDLDETGAAVPVDRDPGLNTANLALGLVSTPSKRYPEGMRRMVLLGDPTRALGALAVGA
jgi:hypothetical protein